MPVIAGGVEASLRRIAHYDYWSDKVWPSSLVTSKAHALVYGMGEAPILEIARRLDAGLGVEGLRDLRGVAYLLGQERVRCPRTAGTTRTARTRTWSCRASRPSSPTRRAFAVMTHDMHRETNPLNARRLLQRARRSHARRESADACRCRKRRWTRSTICRTRGGRIRATATRSPPGRRSRTRCRSCAAASAAARSARSPCTRAARSRAAAPSRSWREVRTLAATPGFTGHVSDLGGPTANMYRMRCTQARRRGRLPAALVHTPDGVQAARHRPRADRSELMRAARAVPGREEGARRLGHPHGPRARGSRVPRGARRAPRRRPSEGRARARLRPRARADEEARAEHLRGVRRALRGGVEARGQGAVPGAVLHREPPGLDGGGHDRARGVPEGARLPPAPGAGLHPRADGHRDLHVLDGPRTRSR